MNENLAKAAASKPAGSDPASGGENLALIYQEILTALTRLRANPEAVTDAEAFRSSMKAALTAAEADAIRKGYTERDAGLATYALVAFLDESVASSNNPNFADWESHTLQGELLGGQTSGETFYDCIDQLLEQPDSPEDADALEVFGLCLLLGYRGQSGTGQRDIRSIVNSITTKVQDIRGPRRMAPDWAPPQDAAPQPPQDPWIRSLAFGTIGALLLAILSFVGFKVALQTGIAGLHSIATLTPP